MTPILCFGEVLWDLFPTGRFIGGAPFNVACHIQALGGSSVVVSRVGNDEHGREILESCRNRNIETRWIQTDAALHTGTVAVTFKKSESPSFEIATPSAWDAIALEPGLEELARSARAIVFGTLAQRSEISRATLRALLEFTPTRIYDINLRPPFDTRAVVEESLALATIVKLNDDELAVLCKWFDLPFDWPKAAMAITDRFGPQTISLTRGSRGASVWHDGRSYEKTGVSIQMIDPVGAGDAFLAAWLHHWFSGSSPEMTLSFANAVGAFVAGRAGAVPTLDLQEIENIINLERKK